MAIETDGARVRLVELQLQVPFQVGGRKGVQGLSGDGEVLAAEIAKSSGHAMLDEAALRAVRATTRFPPGQREIFFPVTFALR